MMRAALIWTVFHLQNDRKICYFDCHRQFLPLNLLYRGTRKPSLKIELKERLQGRGSPDMRSMIASMNIAIDMNVEPTFPVKHCALRKKQYDENTDDEDVRSPEEAFENDYFNVITDMAIASLGIRIQDSPRGFVD
ncbi:hypothetical protein Sango_1255700 [Sesamum angolense]|uniref:Uncharacterized protein n=1 Tax=Sesamum angolense TaxID=2727404 RepID=A0AAE2BU23_9LAMI|nr:hypothetical protein Sango_1255700 [Sesamum angolense]